MNFCSFPILLITARSPGIVLRMEETSNREVALGGGDPEVGASGVEDHREVLRRRPDPDLPEVLRIHVVLQRHDIGIVGIAVAERTVESPSEPVLSRRGRLDDGVEGGLSEA